MSLAQRNYLRMPHTTHNFRNPLKKFSKKIKNKFSRLSSLIIQVFTQDFNLGRGRDLFGTNKSEKEQQILKIAEQKILTGQGRLKL